VLMVVRENPVTSINSRIIFPLLSIIKMPAELWALSLDDRCMLKFLRGTVWDKFLKVSIVGTSFN
jgi:hypothetical protein